MNKFIILQLAGFGDTLSAITRLPAVKEKYPEHEIVFYLGGYGKSVQFSKQQLEREGYKANIIKNFNFHNQIPNMKEFLNKNIVKEGDILEDWSFCDEIFNNINPIFYQYEMQFPYQYKTSCEKEINDKVIAIHPLTKSGNAEGFESDVRNGRFWSRDEWKNLCVKICDNGYTPAFVGFGDEDWGLIEELSNDGYNVLDKRMEVEETISFLQTVDAGIFCNSWDWEITSRAGIPTFSFYTKNHFFIQNHIPHGTSDFWNTCYIETNNKISNNVGKLENNNITIQGVDANSVYDKINYIINNNTKPNYPYTVCMIGMNNEEYIQDTYDNMLPYISENRENQFVMIDGGSTDSTNDLTIKFMEQTNLPEENLSLIYNEWPGDHSVQKNKSIEQAKNKWIVWLDTDETYENIFWNQLGWYIRDAENHNFDSIDFPRINTLYTNDKDKLEKFCEAKRWNLNPFGWINYPDFQQRVFTNDCRYENEVHIRLYNTKNEKCVLGVHCLHPKTLDKQIEQLKSYGEYIPSLEEEESVLSYYSHINITDENNLWSYNINRDIFRENFKNGKKLWMVNVYNGSVEKIITGYNENTFIHNSENFLDENEKINSINKALEFAMNSHRDYVIISNSDYLFLHEPFYENLLNSFCQSGKPFAAAIHHSFEYPLTDLMLFKKSFINKIFPIKNIVNSDRRNIEFLDYEYKFHNNGFDNLGEWIYNMLVENGDIDKLWWKFPRENHPDYHFTRDLAHGRFPPDILRKILDSNNIKNGYFIQSFLKG